MTKSIPPDIQRIVEALRQRQMQVTGPMFKDGESVYRVNQHSVTEAELRMLANEDQLTTWGIFSYVRRRDQNRMR